MRYQCALKKIADWFTHKNVDLVICGCNTTLSLFESTLDQLFHCPVVNLMTSVTSLEKSPYTIISTENTAKSRTLSNILQTHNPTSTFTDIACPGLAKAIETNQHHQQEQILKKILPNIKTKHVILGCTHYPLIQPLFHKQKKDMILIDPAKYININSMIPSDTMSTNTVTFNVSGSLPLFETLVNHYLIDKNNTTITFKKDRQNSIHFINAKRTTSFNIC